MPGVLVTYDTEADVLRIDLGVGVNEAVPPRTEYSREIDSYRWLRYDREHRLLGVDILAARQKGIDLRGVPEADRIQAGIENLKGALGLVLIA